ncbi:hypothetical protein BCR44DRAFT_24320 [Catenaria anguillulae PL171]|uniref:Uncharacterized protein n=1 Tax=Catenaria anguillulae PL171 TaxID=765915 RepID=A0A1Y2HCK4_9FUNG|nr:hypothetical protein BCR44DRAFT_24320 [Catenaria anguillulae PL171]
MVDTRVEEKQRMRQELAIRLGFDDSILAYYEQLQRSERDLRRSRASSANLEPPSNYFPFGQEQPKARIAHDLIQRAPPVKSIEVRQELQLAMREQLKQKEEARQQEREQQLNHVESGLIPPASSQRASARIKNRFSDGRWDGPPPNMNFGTGGGGAPNYDPTTGLIRTCLPVSLLPQPPLSVHDPAVAAAQAQYRAMLDYQRMLSAAHQQQQMYQSHEPGLSFIANPSAPMDPSARYPLNHTDVVKPESGPLTLGTSGPGVQPTRRSRRASASAAAADGVRPAGFDLPVVYPTAYGMPPQPQPECFYFGLPNQRRVQRRQRSQSELGPATEHGKELARDPRHFGTDVTRYQEALIRDAQVVRPGVVYHQGQAVERHYNGQQASPSAPQQQMHRQTEVSQQPVLQQQPTQQQQGQTEAKPSAQRSRRASRQSQYSVPRARSMPGPS